MTSGRLYAFGRFRLDADARLLFRDEQRIQLTPKAIDVLVTLIENRGAPVARDELFHRVWSDAAVEDGTLSSHVSLLRKALGGQFIETIPKRGYRFAGAVEERPADSRILLAVLPFENLSGKKKHDPFSDGLTEEMITQLGRLNPARLGVIARTSSMTYKSTDKTIEQIGRELGVSYVMEGSVRRFGGRVRITAQLIQVSDQTHLWAENYEGSFEDILSLQSRVSREVARQTRIRLLAPEQTRLENVRPVVPAAYDAYLQGRYLWHRRTEHDLLTSIRCFEESARSDPDYAPAYAGIADAYLTLMDHGYLPAGEATAQARRLVLKALRLDGSLAEAHVSLGHAAFHDFDWPTAESELVRGIELNPNYSVAHHYYSNYLTAMGRLAEAVDEAEEAKRLDPVSPAEHSNLASILWYAGDYERSIEEAQKTLDVNPDYSRAYEDLGRVYEQIGLFDDAIDAFQKALSMEGETHGILASLAHVYASAGRRDETMEILRRLEEAARTTFVSAYDFVLIFAALGKTDEAFVWLEKACSERSGALPFLKVNPRFASLRDDPRFEKLLHRLGLQEERMS